MSVSAYGKALALRFLFQGDDTGRPSAWGIGLATALPTETINGLATVSERWRIAERRAR
jgi:hypothetical protein